MDKIVKESMARIYKYAQGPITDETTEEEKAYENAITEYGGNIEDKTQDTAPDSGDANKD